jgi:hypothetical protein
MRSDFNRTPHIQEIALGGVLVYRASYFPARVAGERPAGNPGTWKGQVRPTQMNPNTRMNHIKKKIPAEYSRATVYFLFNFNPPNSPRQTQ